MKKIFVTENVELFRDADAEKMLQVENDLKYFNVEENGIHKVTKERWERAQRFERKIWIDNSPFATDDRNAEHLEKFESLNSVRDRLATKQRVIELGCGPFTNLRLFLDMFSSPEVTLLDPLINQYINHAHCPYKTGYLNSIPATLINSPVENFDCAGKYDVVIMINVIEHCFDADAIFNKILNILDKDGVFIFSDVYFTDVRELASNIYDAGHPLRISESKLNDFLGNFKTIFEKRYNGLYEQEWRNDIYFVGTV